MKLTKKDIEEIRTIYTFKKMLKKSKKSVDKSIKPCYTVYKK